MKPGEEARSLREHPLPPDLTEAPFDADHFVFDPKSAPTQVIRIEKEIEIYEKKQREIAEKISTLYDLRATVVSRAVAESAMEDHQYCIKKVITFGDRVPDITKLKEKSPEMWAQYVDAIKQKSVQDAKIKIAKTFEAIDKTLNLGIADKVFGKKVVDSCCTHPEIVSYEVTKR